MGINIVGVRFKKAGKIYYFSPEEKQYDLNEKVVVETARGVEMGTIAIANRNVKEDSIVAPLKSVLRAATKEDIRIYEENKALAEKASEIFKTKAQNNNLEMILIGS